MRGISIRQLSDSEFQATRELVASHPDQHTKYVVKRLPNFFPISHFLDPPQAYAARQKLVLAAYHHQKMIGTVAAEPVGSHCSIDLTESHWDRFLGRFSQHEYQIYREWESALLKTYIGGPVGALMMHSLAVVPECRRTGVAKMLIEALLTRLSLDDKAALYTETARHSWLPSLFQTLGFVVVRRTFSLSERMEFGCWGSVLLKYNSLSTS